ncbi:right-handed parallel beta-helix repeat-containing protein [Nonomuraea turcica]|uniref:right-handed parallel beta-helix repeat-containing protein n=1 Tax=Nonomuraea sp. G32 TaxID=3067274 RepID=UPI00273BE37D|nr:right-handed parallel beta-helix repeat-containing protein [Nonomuraea sp. G32]MDP4506123.1 right-handed parallel beta-helix repeat-containing protein [Nonomuraea sp. G32]
MGPMRRIAAVVALASGLLLPAGVAFAHEEREVSFPDGTGTVPRLRTGEPDVLVCKSDQADFERRIAKFPARLQERNRDLFAKCQENGARHLQEAVDQVDRPGMTIAILPGLYREEPSHAAPTGDCARLPARWAHHGGYQILSFDQQRQCPHNQNLVAILGKEDLQIEGTGAGPLDVVIDAEYRKLNAIRADRADGVYFRNFTAQRTTFNSLYVLETDGFVIDEVLTRWNDEYGFLTFASDHGLYTDCESYGNGDGGLYPGSASDINDGRGHDVPRYAIEIRRCKSHDNALGYSGTAGDSVWAHDNEFYGNMVGATMDSLWPSHPGLPQNHARFENNKIYDNNRDYYRYLRNGTCAKPPAQRGYEQGVVCPQVGVPSGTGVLVAGGNYNVFTGNRIWGHRRAAFQLFGVPAFIRGETDLAKQADTSDFNRYERNVFGVTPAGERQPNGLDVWWDGQGTGNCWQGDTGTSTPAVLPVCADRVPELSGGTRRILAEPVKLIKLYMCADFSASEVRLPAGCDWFGASGLGTVEALLALAGSVVLGLLAGLFWWRSRRAAGLPGATFRMTFGASFHVTAGAGRRPEAGARIGGEEDDPSGNRRRHRLIVAGTLAGTAGLVLDVVAAAVGSPRQAGVALLLMAAWWLCLGAALRARRPVFGWFTVVLGVLAVADAFDRLVHLIPFVPLGPGWVRGLLTGLWVVCAVLVLVLRDSRSADKSTAEAEVPA